MKNKIIKLANALCSAPGVSGREESVAEILTERLSKYGKPETTKLGSVVCCVNDGKPGAPHLLLTAHLDQVGMIVTKVEENGFLRVSAVGGLDRRLLAAQRLTVHTENGDVPAVVASTPPHLQSGEETVPKIEEIIIDTGLCGNEADILSVGDVITFKSGFKTLNENTIASAALDDRIGCTAVLLAAEKLAKQQPNCKISVLFASQEETGCAGSLGDIFNIKPDSAIAVDVSFANGFGIPETKCGKLGGGAMIGIAPILDRKMYKAFLKLAEKNKTVCQTEVMSGRTSTDADSIVTAVGGIRTALLSIPLRNMHTPTELVRISDVETVVKLIAAFAEEAENYVD